MGGALPWELCHCIDITTTYGITLRRRNSQALAECWPAFQDERVRLRASIQVGTASSSEAHALAQLSGSRRRSACWLIDATIQHAGRYRRRSAALARLARQVARSSSVPRPAVAVAAQNWGWSQSAPA